MIDCTTVRPQLMALLDEELLESDVESIQLHLDDCTDCAGIMADYSALRTAIQSAPIAETDDLWNAVSAEIHAEDSSEAILNELRKMKQEMALLRGEVHNLKSEVTDLRNELAKRLAEPVTRRLPLSLPNVPLASQRPYRLV